MNKTKRIESIQGLRAVCFAAIFLSHTGAVDNNLGGWGVSVFLVMSGFLMYLSYCEKEIECSVKNCMSVVKRKVMRLYPLHLIMLIPAVALELALIAFGRSNESVIHLLVRLIPNALLIHTWFPDQSVYFGFNGVAWYLATYAFIVLSFLPLMCLMKKDKGWTVRKACLCLIGCISIPIIASFVMEFQRAGGYSAFGFYMYFLL